MWFSTLDREPFCSSSVKLSLQMLSFSSAHEPPRGQLCESRLSQVKHHVSVRQYQETDTEGQGVWAASRVRQTASVCLRPWLLRIYKPPKRGQREPLSQHIRPPSHLAVLGLGSLTSLSCHAFYRFSQLTPHFQVSFLLFLWEDFSEYLHSYILP